MTGQNCSGDNCQIAGKNGGASYAGNIAGGTGSFSVAQEMQEQEAQAEEEEVHNLKAVAVPEEQEKLDIDSYESNNFYLCI